MFKGYLILFLIAHVIGDFYIQNSKMAEKKMESIKWVLLHIFCHWIVMLLIYLPIMSWKFLIGVTLTAILHCFVDIAKYILYKNKKIEITQIKDRNLFFIDQIIHMIILIGISYCFARYSLQPVITKNSLQPLLTEAFLNFFQTIGIPPIHVLSWILALLLIHKPANIAISKLLMVYRLENGVENNKGNITVGEFIGTMERIMMLIFIFIGQYSLIGLVLTAKSIARYDRIAKEKDFAEYYLLGTLMSTVAAVVVSFIF